MGKEEPYLLVGFVLGLLLGVVGFSLYDQGGSDYAVDYEPSAGEIDTNAVDVGNKTLEYLTEAFLESQGLVGTVVNAEAYGPNLVRVDITINQEGRPLDSTSVFVTADGETVLFLAQPPLNMSGTLDLGSDEPVQPERMDINIEGDPFVGDPNAPVTIIEFSDFECPYCARGSETMKQIRDTYVAEGKVKLVFKDFPLGFHKYAIKAAEASMCAYEQDEFWAYHDLLFENQDALDIDSLKKYAGEIGLTTDDFNECLDSSRYASEVERDLLEGQAVGVSGTPAFFINGKLVSGAQPYSTFVAMIEAELAE